MSTNSNKPFVFCGFGIGGRHYGVFRYTEQILLHMDALISERGLDTDIRVLVPSDCEWDPGFKNIRIVRKGRYAENSRIEKVITRAVWKHCCFPCYVKSAGGIGIDLLLAFPRGHVKLTALHDCIRESYYAERGDNSRYQRRYLKNVKRAVNAPDMKIVTVSEFSRGELMKYYQLPKERIEIIGNGWEHMESVVPDNSVLDRLGLNKGRGYFFSLGSKEPHKNIKWLIDAARKNPDYDFVLTGQSPAGDEGGRCGLKNVIATGYLDDSQMKALMLGCRAFIQPSFTEGFGIPPLEALSLGKQIIVSNAASLPEIFKDSALYIDPNSEAVDLNALTADPAGDPQPVLEAYTWRNSALKMLKLLQTL